MATIAACLGRAAGLAGDDAGRAAELLLGAAVDRPRAFLYSHPEYELSTAEAERFEALLARRAAGEPVAYLLGEWAFWNLTLAVTPATLIPRADTERLVEVALLLEVPAAARVVDLGTGTGAIALALAAERPGWQVTAVDREPACVELARANAAANGVGVKVLVSDWFAALAGRRFDLVVSNPPYVAEGDPHLGEGDVRFEPRGALVAGDGGLAAIRAIADAAPGYLVPGGWLAVEHGFEQGAAVRALFTASGFESVQTCADLGGRERVTAGRCGEGGP